MSAKNPGSLKMRSCLSTCHVYKEHNDSPNFGIPFFQTTNSWGLSRASAPFSPNQWQNDCGRWQTNRFDGLAPIRTFHPCGRGRPSGCRCPPCFLGDHAGGAFPHEKSSCYGWNDLATPSEIHHLLYRQSTWLGGKSLVRGGFDGKIIYELAMFGTFDYWRVYISPCITLTGYWLVVWNILCVSKIYGMSSFPLTFTPSFLKMVKLHHQAVHSISIR